jgi:hypothetical protein
MLSRYHTCDSLDKGHGQLFAEDSRLQDLQGEHTTLPNSIFQTQNSGEDVLNTAEDERMAKVCRVLKMKVEEMKSKLLRESNQEKNQEKAHKHLQKELEHAQGEKIAASQRLLSSKQAISKSAYLGKGVGESSIIKKPIAGGGPSSSTDLYRSNRGLLLLDKRLYLAENEVSTSRRSDTEQSKDICLDSFDTAGQTIVEEGPATHQRRRDINQKAFYFGARVDKRKIAAPVHERRPCKDESKVSLHSSAFHSKDHCGGIGHSRGYSGHEESLKSNAIICKHDHDQSKRRPARGQIGTEKGGCGTSYNYKVLSTGSCTVSRMKPSTSGINPSDLPTQNANKENERPNRQAGETSRVNKIYQCGISDKQSNNITFGYQENTYVGNFDSKNSHQTSIINHQPSENRLETSPTRGQFKRSVGAGQTQKGLVSSGGSMDLVCEQHPSSRPPAETRKLASEQISTDDAIQQSVDQVLGVVSKGELFDLEFELEI